MLEESKPPARSLMFGTPMIDALKARRKTQSRRILKYPESVLKKRGRHWQPWLEKAEVISWSLIDAGWSPFIANPNYVAPPVPELLRAGTRVWVRESFSTMHLGMHPFPKAWYRADFDDYSDPARPENRDVHSSSCRDVGRGIDCQACAGEREGHFKWKSARFMPRALSRFELEVVSIRVEPLEAITEEDALAEGIERIPVNDTHGLQHIHRVEGADFGSARTAFAFAWDGINGDKHPFESNPHVRRIEFRVVKGAQS